jgi:hypothetical protein
MADHRMVPLSTADRARLIEAINANANKGAAILTGPDTAFSGVALDGLPNTDVVGAIKSVPCHY